MIFIKDGFTLQLVAPIKRKILLHYLIPLLDPGFLDHHHLTLG